MAEGGQYWGVRSTAVLLFACLSVSCASNPPPPPTAPQGDAGEPVPECSGKPGALRGKSTHKLMAGGRERSFIYYAPSGLDPDQPTPLVIVAHGYGMNAEQMYELTRYPELAEREQFLVIFPNGQDPSAPWNVGDPDCITPTGALPLADGDDQAFIDELLSFVDRDQCLDRRHVFMTGFSMGGYFTNEVGCLRDDIRAIAPHSSGTHDLSECPGDRKPALVLHFAGDVLVPYRCGTQTRDRWLKRNGCRADSPTVRTVEGGRCEYYRGCPEDGQVALCSFMNPDGERTEANAGHAWSGGSKEGDAGGARYAIPETQSATELSWEFFKRYAW
ncbi:MAG TPA: PHB depolymerase family esterase [Polyangiales bacterium]|nr:PHB depolymerase family esterase [Polyangiales bacterium]